MLTHQQGRAAPVGGLTDADLIELSRHDPACFAMIFDRHSREILRYAHARLGPDLAEDVAAETFLDAFRNRDRYDITRPDARPWLYGIAVRQIGRHRRALSRQLKLLRSAPAELVTEDFGSRAAERSPPSSSGRGWPRSCPGCAAMIANYCCSWPGRA
ncbi:MAG TPA: sigma factor [Streptosporangiaceae bacterium]